MTEKTKSMDLREYYKRDERFRGYVDRISATYRRPVEEVLQFALVREAAKYYQEEAAEKGEKIAANKSSYMPMGECI